MNNLAIDYGTKTIGLAYSINDIIFTLPSIKNNSDVYKNIKNIVDDYSIDNIYIGLSMGKMAIKIKSFANELSRVIKLPVNTVEEAVSTIEATELFFKNKNKKKFLHSTIDSISAAVILRRVIN